MAIRPLSRMRQSNRNLVSTQISSWLNFTPLTFRPTLWLDASDTATITASSGAVSQWNDKSGNGYHVSQATSTRQPTTNVSTQNGLNIINFDGGDFLYRNQQIFTTAVTVFVAVSFADNTSRYVAVDLGYTVSSSFMGFAIEQNTYSTAGQRYGIYSSGSSNDSATATSAGMKLISADANTTSGGNIVDNTQYKVNAVFSGLTRRQGNVTYSSFSSLNGFGVGAFNQNGTPSLPMNGSIAEIIAFNTRLTNNQIATMEQYFNKKWKLW